MPKKIITKILNNEKISSDIYRMKIASLYLARSARPGQFVEVMCSGDDSIILRRPFGVHRIFGNGIEILYEVVGKGTGFLSKKRPGDTIDVIGPLGNGFDIKPSEAKEAILVAGGIGVAPLMSLADKIAASVERIGISVFIGAKTKKHILCAEEFKKIGAKIHVATDDGSLGYKGFVTDLLKKFLPNTQYPIRNTIYACGPRPMLKALSHITVKYKIACQISLEERMACGVGVCLGCPVKVRKNNTQYEYKMVCKDGPVFSAREVLW